MSTNNLYDRAGKAAFRDLNRATASLGRTLPRAPGVEPLPWKEQAAQFIDAAPDLLLNGPKGQRWQEIEATMGPGEAEKYVTAMLAQFGKPRQRRSPH